MKHQVIVLGGGDVDGEAKKKKKKNPRSERAENGGRKEEKTESALTEGWTTVFFLFLGIRQIWIQNGFYHLLAV